IGSRYFTVRLRVDGKLEANPTLRGRLEATAPVVVASRDMKRSTVLSAGDLEVEKRDITRSDDPLLGKRKATGMRLKRSVRSGDILERRNLARPILVQRGEVVTMEASKGRLLLTAKGVARSRGKKGETIKVRNTGSQREILCKVVGSGRVRVEF
ncbi:MAG: flagellar basal body P-ring formation chaperone FlgA, partial [Desulfohalobiaceae bacterium]|nr:flagellar basal body P-ring formation chaperone FlgA [Desulfohalobiaceae bacterium]